MYQVKTITFKLKPGPHYSKDIKELGILKEYDVLFSYDMNTNDIKIDTITKLLG